MSRRAWCSLDKARTDFRTAVLELVRRRLAVGSYLHSLATFDTESVFSRDDPLPGIVELGLIPYLMKKRGF